MPARAILFLLLISLFPSAALADIIAVYSARFGSGYRVEIADNGDMRADLEAGQVLLVSGREAYLVEERLTGPIVTRLEDLTALWAEHCRRADALCGRSGLIALGATRKVSRERQNRHRLFPAPE